MFPNHDHETVDSFIRAIHEHYLSLRFTPPKGQFTVLAAFYLASTIDSDAPKVISLATGTKCLPGSKLPRHGEALHDSHAEVLARRGAVRWLLEEIGRDMCSGYQSPWLTQSVAGEHKWRLKDGIGLYLYVSTPPCGDASMRYIAAFQDAAMKALKDAVAPGLPHTTPAVPYIGSLPLARGRNNYGLFGALRTKPGRGDSPPTSSMSCTDKVARWNILGIQGALGSRFLAPLYLSGMIIGLDVGALEHDSEDLEDLEALVREDCERGFWGRVCPQVGGQLPADFAIHKPPILFSKIPFTHAAAPDTAGSCNESLCWIPESPSFPEVLINGLRRGVSPKHRLTPSYRPWLSKISILDLYHQLLQSEEVHRAAAYYDIKISASVMFQKAKAALLGTGGPFCEWVVSGQEWESFNAGGELVIFEHINDG